MRRIAVAWVLLCLALCGSVIAAAEDSSATSLEAPSLTLSGTYGGNAQTARIALGDVDSDGDLDAVFANMHGPSELWLNDGQGVFSKANQYFREDVTDAALGDLDGDGDLDVFFATGTDEAPCAVYVNDGTGRFSPASSLPYLHEGAALVSLVDLENDGDLDAAVYYNSLRTLFYINDGLAQFRASTAQIAGMTVWGDLDGDGDSDAVCVSRSGEYTTLLNDGAGALTTTTVLQAPAPDTPGSMVLGDIDGDADLDLVVAPGESGPQSLALLLNDGTGAFTYVAEPRLPVQFARLTLGDLNGDGRVDVFIGYSERPNRVGLNSGGGFVDSGLLLGGPYFEGKSAIGDLDGDGDLDLFVARYLPQGPNEVWKNGAE